MKPTLALRTFLLGSTIFAATPMAHAVDYYWDTNNSTSGFGTSSGGTWGTSAFWSTSSAGTAATANTTILVTDTVHFGTATDGFSTAGAPAHVLFNGAKTVANITYGSASTAAVVINNASTLTLAATSIITQNNAFGTNIAGVVAGAGTSLTKEGTGIQSFSGISNTWTGATIINGGIIQAQQIGNGGVASSIGQSTNDAANLVLNGGTLQKFGASTGTTDRLFTLGTNGGGLTNVGSSGDFVLNNTGNIVATGTTDRTLTLGGSFGSNSLAPILTNASGGGVVSLVKNGTNAWSVSGTTNSYSGGTTVNQGTLSFGATGLMGASTGALAVNNTNSTTAGTNTVLNLATGQNTTTGSLSGTIATPTSGTNTATINITSGRTFTVNQTTDGTYAGVIAGSGGAFTLGGLSTNKLTLTGASTYTGATTIAEGTLAVNGSLANTSTTVQSGATLQGSGSIGGSLTVQGGGTLASGNSIESLATGSLSLESLSTFAYEMNKDASATVAGDLTAVTGTLDIASGAILTLSELGSGVWAEDEKLTLISYSGAWDNGLFTYLGSPLADDSTISFSGIDWIFNYNDTVAGSNYTGDLTSPGFVTMTAIPEPGAALLGSLGLLALLRRRRGPLS